MIENKVHKMVKDILSPALGRPAEELEELTSLWFR